MPGHLLNDYPLIQKMGEKRRFKKKDDNSAMIAAWSDGEQVTVKVMKNTLPTTVSLLRKYKTMKDLSMKALMR